MSKLARHRLCASYLLACLALLTLAIRALMPAGYMPSASAARHGKLELAICSPSGAHASAWVDVEFPPEHGGAPECPFWILLAPAGLPPTPLAALPALPAILPLPVLAAFTAGPSLPARGPPLGSRAPPRAVAPRAIDPGFQRTT